MIRICKGFVPYNTLPTLQKTAQTTRDYCLMLILAQGWKALDQNSKISLYCSYNDKKLHDIHLIRIEML